MNAQNVNLLSEFLSPRLVFLDNTNDFIIAKRKLCMKGILISTCESVISLEAA